MNLLFLRALASLALFAALLCLAPSAVALPHDIPFKQSTPDEDNLIYRAVLAFVAAGAVAYGLAWSIKRYLPRLGKRLGSQIGQGRQLERLEILRLSGRSMLVRVRWGDEELLIGENEHSVSLLGRKTQQHAEPEGTMPGTSSKETP